jgi:hypothetical protein
MKSKKTMRMEVLPSPAELARTPAMESEIRRLAVEMAAQIVAQKEQFLFEPFFRSRQVAYELKRLQTVSEQRTWQVYNARFGCLLCETTERIHMGCGMCNRCYQSTLQRLKQIRGEQIREEMARPARGRIRLDRMIPENAPVDGVHHTLYERSTEKERKLFQRVATQRGLTYDYVRCVGVGLRRNDAVSAALKKERELR